MTLKSAVLGTFATTAVLAGSFLASAPAQALSLDGQLSFNGSVNISSSTQNEFLYDFLVSGQSSGKGTPGTLTFDSGTSTGSFSGIGGSGEIKDLATTVNEGGFLAPQISEFITGITLSSGKVVSFTLDSVVSTAIGIGTNRNPRSFNLADLTGFFTDTSNGQVVALGSLSGQFGTPDGTGISTFSGRLEASEVPTPALLPGLVGMGVAALRKRKSEEEETVEA